ncbi:MAG: malonyl-CoA decarboxylase family protein, partial [Alphaproteobacteria bacterium]|nr:malonyl-CoA decarboxylase family protein [Alphaproteobacteria bacterium]
FLIKRVVDTLAVEFKGLSTYATLSPIPGFTRWIRRTLEDDSAALMDKDDNDALAEAFVTVDGEEAMRRILDTPDWASDQTLTDAAEPILTRMAARFLLTEKNSRGRVADPVAHFHLSNGALVERLNWMGDKSAHGIGRSAGLMVNYLYNLGRIEENHEAYTGEGRVTASSVVEKLARL